MIANVLALRSTTSWNTPLATQPTCTRLASMLAKKTPMKEMQIEKHRILITTLLNHSPSYAETTTRQCLEHLIMYIRASQHSHPDPKSSQFLLRQHPQDCPHIPKWFFWVQRSGTDLSQTLQCHPYHQGKHISQSHDCAAMSCEPIQGSTNPTM